MTVTPDGWILVPAEMTREMEEAWKQAFNQQLHRRMKGGRKGGQIRRAKEESAEAVAWRAALAKAPKIEGQS